MADRGILYLVATPIGNLEDMTFRAVRVLKGADLIAAEDTRGSIRLLNHFEIHTPMTSYHEYNKVAKARTLVDKMLSGQTVACVTGMPAYRWFPSPGRARLSMRSFPPDRRPEGSALRRSFLQKKRRGMLSWKN